MNTVTRWLALAGIVMLSACAGLLDPTPAIQESAARTAQLNALTEWEAEGKIALRTAGQSDSARMRWQQQSAHSRVELSGPLGISATTIESDGNTVTIQQREDSQHWDIDDPAFAAQNLWQLPLRSLHFWLKGIPDPGAPVDNLTLDPANQLPSELAQSGWTIEYQQFEAFGLYWLPTRLQVERGNSRAKIILSNWRIPTAQ